MKYTSITFSMILFDLSELFLHLLIISMWTNTVSWQNISHLCIAKTELIQMPTGFTVLSPYKFYYNHYWMHDISLFVVVTKMYVSLFSCEANTGNNWKHNSAAIFSIKQSTSGQNKRWYRKWNVCIHHCGLYLYWYQHHRISDWLLIYLSV